MNVKRVDAGDIFHAETGLDQPQRRRHQYLGQAARIDEDALPVANVDEAQPLLARGRNAEDILRRNLRRLDQQLVEKIRCWQCDELSVQRREEDVVVLVRANGARIDGNDSETRGICGRRRRC